MTGMKYFIPLVVILSIACATSSASAEESSKRAPLTLKLSSHVAPAPAQVTARISVEPDPRSRRLTVEWWTQDGAGGSHVVSLDGDRAAMRQDFAIKRIEAGTYVVRAVLLRDDGSIVKKESNLIVVGEGSRFISEGSGTELMLEPSGRR
jgi:hypothetical protein